MKTAAGASSGPSASSSTAGTSSLMTVSSSGRVPVLEWKHWVALSVVLYGFYYAAMSAYRIRLLSIQEFGPVIHEFDPYFNYRATEYLYWNGWRRFFTWFDYKVWYPLGRPVGTTIYPGMQFTAVYLKRWFLQNSMSLNDICCYIPAWFGVIASLAVGAIAFECTIPPNTTSNLGNYIVDFLMGEIAGPEHMQPHNWRKQENAASNNALDKAKNAEPKSPLNWFVTLLKESAALECAMAASFMMAILPAHLMRSMGGGYDNESVAVSAMVLTFYFWVRSLRLDDKTSHYYGILTGLSYFYMVAAWGGYVFVLNLIGLHAIMLLIIGRFSDKIYYAYTYFYLIGTLLAIQVPVVGYAPLKSLEQLGPAVVWIFFQIYQFCLVWERRYRYNRSQVIWFRMQIMTALAVLAFVVVVVLAPTGYFGPISARVRGLFVKHTKTGNPLVDSVAEHQPASSRAYYQYLHHVCTLAPLGFIVVIFQLSESSSFLMVWGMVAYFFSLKMVRLILLTAPIGAIFGGIIAGRLVRWCIVQWFNYPLWVATVESGRTGPTTKGKGKKKRTNTASNSADEDTTWMDSASTDESNGISTSKGGKKRNKANTKKSTASPVPKVNPQPLSNEVSLDETNESDGIAAIQQAFQTMMKTESGIMVRRIISVVMIFTLFLIEIAFVNYCWRIAQDLSSPTIILKARRRDGKIIKVDDYREAYWWLRDNTPEDARIMAWWDYGYQISAIANRTTLADGNTWNHEHIALLGKALTTHIDEGWEIARHLADYVLIWGGGGGDDLAKSPHLARIANSVYRDHCPDDPTCRRFTFVDREGTPSTMMANSLLYRLHGFQIKPGVEVPPDKFVEVYRSKFGKVRIYKIEGVSEESKAWVKDPANRKCDVEGSWFCPGQYPPGLSEILRRGKSFQQIEDFNRGNVDEEYLKGYFRDLQDPNAARRKFLQDEQNHLPKESSSFSPQVDEGGENRKQLVDELYNSWADTEDTTLMWKLISSNSIDELRTWLEEEPHKAFVRSQDGRGPMWWAFEQRNEEITRLLMKAGVPHTDRDASGKTPLDLLKGE